MVPNSEDDLGARLLSAGGVNNFLSSTVTDTASLRQIRHVGSLCDAELKTFATRSLKADTQLRTAAQRSVGDARARLDDIRARATETLFEHGERTQKLEDMLQAFKELDEAKMELRAVSACRRIADAYIKALKPLALHQKDGSIAEMDEVAGNVGELIQVVDSVRKKGKILFGEGHGERVVKSVENRAVDALIKARAVFVNVLDNEFRRFGWPMKVPKPGENDDMISNVNFYVKQLSSLQQVARKADYVMERTKWHSALSDSWAMAAILRAPLARFKYHFLESFRGETGQMGTSRFDRPEWAAEFALERIREATPFLGLVMIDGPRKADVKFAEGFCQVFAEKIAYDCELALRASTNDSDADVLIAHASETARQFDAKLRSGVIQVDDEEDVPGMPIFMSSLHVLSLNESFWATWASSELRLANREVDRLLARALGTDGNGDQNTNDMETEVTREDLETICQEMVEHVGNASQKCRALESHERVATFLKLTELPLLQSLRARLKEEVDAIDDMAPTTEQVTRGGRASLCAQLVSDALEDRAIDPFYLKRERTLGRGLYNEEITRLRALHASNCSMLSDAISSGFIDTVKVGYMDQAKFGEISAPDAAVVLTHDLSESLVNPLTSLEGLLNGIRQGMPCRKTASTVWRPIASKIDRFFFDEVVLQCFAGGSRNAMSAASAANSYLSPISCAKMARQLAFDVTMLVSTFQCVTPNPPQFLPFSAECEKVLRIASQRVLLPSVPAGKEDEEVIEALKSIVESDEDEALDSARKVLESRIGLTSIGPREALELLAIGGMKFAIRMM